MNHLPINVNRFIKTLSDNPNLPVVFTHGDYEITPGYHITEVKQAVVNALDCGQGTEQWRELVIELLDGSTRVDNAFMQSNTMLGILNKALLSGTHDENSKLYFEFAPGNNTILKLYVDTIDVVDDAVAVSLAGFSAQCKPYQRALKDVGLAATGAECCGSAPDNDSNLSCCGGEKANSSTSACCA